ncbi:MAG: outer membrane beta-barrel protein [Bacteroidota bacterium]
MKSKFILIALFFLSLSTVSQVKKFSVDLNYPLALKSGYGDESRGIIDGSFKYRFKELNSMTIGASYTFDLIKRESTFAETELGMNYNFHHVNLFSEFKLSSEDKLHPFIGLGYSILFSENEYIYSNMEEVEIKVKKENNSGINVNFGFSYDVTKSFYVQSYFHYVRVFTKSFVEDGKKVGVNYNQLKLGLGYRF